MWFTPPLGVSGTALTLLMPVSSAYAWYSIGLREDPTWTFSWQLGPAALYWLWAWKNRTMGPIFIDAGVASYLPALLLALWSNFHSSATPAMLASPLVCSIGAGCAGVILVNFLVPVAKYLKAARGGVPYPFNGFPNLKPGWWAAVFHFYVHSSFALWGTWLVKAVRANAAAEEPQPGLTMAGSVGCVLLFATLLGAFDKHANAPVKKWLKSQGKANP